MYMYTMYMHAYDKMQRLYNQSVIDHSLAPYTYARNATRNAIVYHVHVVNSQHYST